ncbi:MAG: M1 family metallopeptidase [Promethearchaeota archaeon]
MVEPRPVNYRLHLEPDLERFTFAGRVEIDFSSDEGASEVVLNAKDLTIERCLFRAGTTSEACAFSQSDEEETLRIKLPAETTGPFSLDLEFAGKINDKLVGFYRSRYEQDGDIKYIAVTQFEETDARRAFPCVDHPGFKASFEVELLIDQNLEAIGNTPVEEEKRVGGKKLVRFKKTPRMCTYLLFLGVGDFEFIESKSNGLLVRVATPPGLTEYGDFALDFGRKSLEYGEEYTGEKFPLGKCDFIAVSDFAFGAMENWGAITFRENLLLYYPGVTSKAALQRLTEVIAHEVAHMWFGDLVSPADWQYLWLNESFASLFTYQIPDHYFPERNLWERFVSLEYAGALNRDCLLETFPIELPGGQQARINEATYNIIYHKGASILRMLKNYLGEDKFRAGIKHFLEKFKFGNATSEDYWKAFEEATGEPVREFADSWIHQPGYPIVKAERVGEKLRLTQRRFTLLPGDSGQTWTIPLSIKTQGEGGTLREIRQVFRTETLTVDLPAGTKYFKVNKDQYGFYRVEYAEEDLEKLGEGVRKKELSAFDRFGIENDFFALVLARRYSVDDYLRFLETHYIGEDSYLPLSGICGDLSSALLLFPRLENEISDVGRKILGAVFEKIGLEPREEDSFLTSSLRDTLLWTAFLLGDEEVRIWGEQQFKNLVAGGTVHEDVKASVLRIGAAVDSDATDYIYGKLEDPNTPESEIIDLLVALGSFRNPSKLYEALNYTLEKVPLKNRSYPISAASRNPAALAGLWDWFREHLESLEKLPPMHFERTIHLLAPICGLDRKGEVRTFLEEYKRKKDLARDTINMALEKLEIFSRLR